MLKSGVSFIREIDTASLNPDGTMNLITTATNGINFTIDEVRIISLVGWTRLFSDKIDIKYLDRNVATVKTSMVNILL